MRLAALCFFYTSDFYPQRGDEEIGWGIGEIYIGTRRLDEEEFVYYKMETMGAFYGGGPLLVPAQPFTMNYPLIYQNAIAHYISGYQIIQEISNTNFSLFNWPYFRMIFLDDGGSNSFGYGIYKLFIEPYSAYFYIDYRDTDYGSYTNCNGHCQDTVEIPSQTGNQPRLVWGPHPYSSYNNGFNVYRAIVSPGQPELAVGNFALFAPNGNRISKKLSVIK